MKILFTGGGTGGHIYPIIAVCRELHKIYPSVSNSQKANSQKNKQKKELELFYIGPRDKFGKMLLSQEGIKVTEIVAGKLRRYFGPITFFQNIIDIVFKIPIGIVQSFFYIFFLNPDLIFSKGGYGSLPAVISGWLLRVPVFLHESDISPGLANRFLNKLSVEVFVSFPRTEYFSVKKMILVGNPVRREILLGTQEEAKNLFELTGEKPVVLVFGGSQGAQRINEAILQILPTILTTFEVIHQCGERNFKQMQAESKVMITKDLAKYYHLFSLLREKELKQAYQIADFIISRGGSGSIFEIAAIGKPSILIPLPKSAQDHQLKNAYSYCETGACFVIEEVNLAPHFFLERLKYLISNPKEMKNMETAAISFAKPRAAQVIAQYLLEYLMR